MDFVCSLNFVDVNILVYLVRRPRTAGIVSLKKKKKKFVRFSVRFYCPVQMQAYSLAQTL